MGDETDIVELELNDEVILLDRNVDDEFESFVSSNNTTENSQMEQELEKLILEADAEEDGFVI